MGRISKLLSLQAEERRLLLGAAFLLAAIVPALRLLPFGTLRGVLDRLSSRGEKSPEARRGLSPERVCWVVGVASRYVPGAASCLPRALATQVLLSRQGYPAHLRLGVSQGEGSELEAHAWVDSAGRTVMGGGENDRFVRLPDPEGEGA
jgi:hypothetical protein